MQSEVKIKSFVKISRYQLLKLLFVLFLGVIFFIGIYAFWGENSKNHVIKIKLSQKYRAWQGVATDGKNIYVVSDRDEKFDLEDIISVYSMGGKFVKEKRHAYTKTDASGKFMSFGGISISDNKLLATVYNINGGGTPYISRVLEYSLPDLTIVKEVEIGEGVAESIQKYDGFYWVTYYDRQEIGQFDLNFQHIKNYKLSKLMGIYGGYQGMMWYKGKVYLNMHGPNKYGEEAVESLDCYSFDGNKFTYVKTMKPATYGTTQDIQYFNHKFYWNDRPANEIVISTKLEQLRNRNK